MTFVLALAAGLFGFFLRRWLDRRAAARPGRQLRYCLLYTGDVMELHPAEEKQDHILVKGTEYGFPLVHTLDLPLLRLYVVLLNQVAVGDQRALQIARRSVAMRRLFASNSDLQYVLTLAALAVPILISLYWLGQIGELRELLIQTVANTQTVRDVVSEPLQVIPQLVPTVTP